ncbi:hypothetical protein SD81_013765 [Tolypothrix campylonemoides VB511288]|nr:hypothetical protein SD81_013765 [Tolypothrix campylonemoides VB511288]
MKAVTGEEYLRLKEHSKTEDVSAYFAEFCLDCVKQGVTKLTVILDNNSTGRGVPPATSPVGWWREERRPGTGYWVLGNCSKIWEGLKPLP